jgi:hypothetical protein
MGGGNRQGVESVGSSNSAGKGNTTWGDVVEIGKDVVAERRGSSAGGRKRGGNRP